MSPSPSRVDQALTLAVLAMLNHRLLLRATAVHHGARVGGDPVHDDVAALLARDGAVARPQRSSAFIMVVLLALLMIAPFIVVGATIADNAALMAQWGRDPREVRHPPAWVSGIPLIGPTVVAYWNSMAHDTAQLLAVLRDYVEPMRKFLVASGASVVGAILQMTLAIFIAWFMFRDGHAIAGHLSRVAQRIAGDRGTHLASVAAATVRGVVLGLLGTALVQGVVAGIGFWIAAIQAHRRRLLTFFLSPVPVGPPFGFPSPVADPRSDGLGSRAAGRTAGRRSTTSKPLIISRGVDRQQLVRWACGGAIAFASLASSSAPCCSPSVALLMEWRRRADEPSSSRRTSTAAQRDHAAPPSGTVRRSTDEMARARD